MSPSSPRTHRSPPRRFAAGVTLCAAALLVLGPQPGPAGAAASYDWPTYGFDLDRSGANPRESTLTAANADGLHSTWSASLGAVSITQPLVAAAVNVSGTPRDLVYVGTAAGKLLALRADTGAEVWHRDLPSVHSDCTDLPGGTYGVDGTPVIDRARNQIFVAAGDAQVYALDLGTGATAPGWPVRVVSHPELNHVWGALTELGNRLFIPTAAMCDITPYHGRVVKIDIPNSQRVKTWWVTGSSTGPDGGGIWGYGGLSARRGPKLLFTATGNGFPETAGYSDQVVELNTGLQVVDNNYPGIAGTDEDFGSTPLLFRNPGCAPQLVALNKTGVLMLYDRDDLAAGPVQQIQVMQPNGLLIGVPAYSASKDLVYVANPGPASGTFVTGMLAFEQTATCQLQLAWQAPAGSAGTTTFSSPTIAGGVVYFGDGTGKALHAFDAADGTPLWDSGTTIGGNVFAAPTVANGRLYAAAWDSKLWCFVP